MMNRRNGARLIGLLTVVVVALTTSFAWSQIPGRGFRSTFPSRVVPAENTAPIEEEQEPTPARELAPPVLKTVPLSAIPNVANADQPQPLREGDVIPTSEIRGRFRPKAGNQFSDSSAPSLKPKELPYPPSASPNEIATSEGEEVGSGEGPEERVTTLVRGEFKEVWNNIKYYWEYNFYKSADDKVKISLQVIVVGLLLIFLGHIFARRLSTWLGGSVFKRMGLPPATAAPLQKMAYYAMFGVFALSSMNTVGLSWDAITFFGGALAIGIGFGSQNVMNNFISGLILLIERPIRVGDVIQIDSFSGKVSEIGARSTRITTGANLEVIIPNSTFLQGNVVNWTLSDDIISSKVVVGVAYGSAARDVSRLLQRAAEEHEQILKTPAPGVSFTDFSADAMQFELSFWLKMSQADRGKVESDLRFKIDELFGDQGIVIAYPQRDVHLNLMRPVEVRLSDSTTAQRELRGAA